MFDQSDLLIKSWLADVPWLGYPITLTSTNDEPDGQYRLLSEEILFYEGARIF
jgi:hypothetical protein